VNREWESIYSCSHIPRVANIVSLQDGARIGQSALLGQIGQLKHFGEE
jgi:hypothetical protein